MACVACWVSGRATRGSIRERASSRSNSTARGVDDINDMGGTVLGTSRGGRDPVDMVDYLEAHDIDILFCVGGDGTQRGAHAIAQEARKRGAARSIVGIPKTIDNDVPYVYMSFGYPTALEGAAEVLRQAHVEAKCHENGIGLVKLMGRDAGFIAAGAAVAAQEANFVLVPEIPFPLRGEGGFLDVLERRILGRGHAVVVTAEGAGQHLFESGDASTDASGNRRYRDIGILLRDHIREHFRRARHPHHGQVLRSQLLHPQRAAQRHRPLPDRPHGAQCRARRHGRQDRRHGRLVEPGHDLGTHRDGHLGAQAHESRR